MKLSDKERKAIQRDQQRSFICWLYILKKDGEITTSSEAVISRMMQLPLEKQRVIKRMLGD